MSKSIEFGMQSLTGGKYKEESNNLNLSEK